MIRLEETELCWEAESINENITVPVTQPYNEDEAKAMDDDGWDYIHKDGELGISKWTNGVELISDGRGGKMTQSPQRWRW